MVLTDGRDALERITRGERFDVVFCDLMMPYLPGDELYARTRLLDPEFSERFVFISGGATDARIADFLAQVPNERVEKPFNVQNLRGIVRRFVNSGSQASWPPPPKHAVR
jgi:CheY-like chemotaxis protein